MNRSGEVNLQRRAFRLEQRVVRLQALLAKRTAQLRQLQGTEPKRLFWVSFVDPSGDAVDVVVYGTTADNAYVVAARLLDDPHGNPMVFEVPKDLYHGPLSERLRPEELEHVARLASGNDAYGSQSAETQPEDCAIGRARSRKT